MRHWCGGKHGEALITVWVQCLIVALLPLGFLWRALAREQAARAELQLSNDVLTDQLARASARVKSLEAVAKKDRVGGCPPCAGGGGAEPAALCVVVVVVVVAAATAAARWSCQGQQPQGCERVEGAAAWRRHAVCTEGLARPAPSHGHGADPLHGRGRPALLAAVRVRGRGARWRAGY
eukprot:COSAG01_NODE_913_length_12779_cov_9.134385_12_plen_179_part_00